MIRVRRVCAVCGRAIPWRRKWSNAPQRLEYCSEDCRARGLGERDRELEEAILALLAERAADASLYPSEVARALAAGGDWRARMDAVRMAARRLHRAGRIDITQHGQRVDPDQVRGPIRLRLRPQDAIQA